MTSLFACDFDESKGNLSGGILLNDEKMSQIKQEILTEEETGNESEDESDKTISNTTESEASSDIDYESKIVVYWTKTGSAWHESVSCSHINNKPNIMAGTIEQAMSAGKTNACSRCCQ